MGRRQLNRETYVGIGELAVGIGFWVNSGALPMPHPTPTYWWVGLGIIIGGIGTILYGLLGKKGRATKHFTPQDLLTVLQEMDEHLRTLAKKEARKNIDWRKYAEVNRQSNKEILGIVATKAKTIKGAKRVASKLESKLLEEYGNSITDIESAVCTMEPNCAFLDAQGFGLKQKRETDRKYRRYYKRLYSYRNLPLGTEINNLISLHVRASECWATTLLAILRATRIKDRDSKTTAVGLATARMQAEIELFEPRMKEFTSAIRSSIGERLEMQGQKDGKKDDNVKQVVDELLTVKAGSEKEKPIYALRVLYHDREKLTKGLYNGNATPLDKIAYHQLDLHGIVKLEQRKERIFGSDNTRDVGYWILTERGKEVIKYLQKNPQVLHSEGSQIE